MINTRRKPLYSRKPCRVCAHGERVAIDKAFLVIGQSPRRMARRYSDLTRRALQHHRDVCLKDAVVEGEGVIPNG